MSLWVFCRYGSNFTDPQRHRECFVDEEGCLQFQETDMRMVAFAQASSCLPRTSAGSCWGKMTVDLPFQVEADLYDEEDVTRPQDFFLCDKSLFMVVELVGVDRVRPQPRLNMPSIRVVGDRASQKQRQGRRHQVPHSQWEVNPPTPRPEVKDPSRTVRRGKAFFKKQARYKPASVWHTKESNAADLRTNATRKSTNESLSEEESVPVKAKTASVKPMTDIDFAILRPRDSISSTEFTSNHDADLLEFSPGPNKRYKQTVMDKQDEYDDSFAKSKSTMASSYNFELECPIAASLQQKMATVDEEVNFYHSSQDLDEIDFGLD